MIENLFIIFAPGLGGNHLSNLISLTTKFTKEVNLDVYNSNMLNAHASSIRNLHSDDIRDNQDQLSIQNNVMCGHIAEYIWLKDQGLDKIFPNKKFMVIQFPHPDSIAYQRLIKVYPYYKNSYNFHEHSTLYSQKYLELLFDEHDFFYIDSEDIFAKSVTGIVKFITDQLHTTIDQLRAQELHSIWFQNING